MESDFIPLLRDPVQVERLIGRDRYTQPLYSPAQEYNGWVEINNRAVRTLDGVTVVAYADIVVDTVDPISTQDRVTLPDGRTPRVLQATLIKDERGPHHVELVVG